MSSLPAHRGLPRIDELPAESLDAARLSKQGTLLLRKRTSELGASSDLARLEQDALQRLKDSDLASIADEDEASPKAKQKARVFKAVKAALSRPDKKAWA